MLQQVALTNTAQSRAFQDFKQPQNGYYINTSQESDTSKKSSHVLLNSIIITGIVLGLGSLAIFGGGFSKNAVKYLVKWKTNLEQKIAKGGKVNNFTRYALVRVNDFIAKSESVNNFSALKDILLQKIMWGKKDARPITRRIHQGITKFFDKVSRKTVNSSYASTQQKFAGLSEYCISLNERILKEHAGNPDYQRLVKEINDKIRRVNLHLNKGFGVNARADRLKEMRKASDGLFDYFWNASLHDVKNFKSPNMYQSFIADDYLIPTKMKLSNQTGRFRQIITHSLEDNYKATINAIGNIQKFVNPSDTNTNNALNALRVNLNNYKKYYKSDNKQELAKVNKEIVDNLKKLSDSFSEMASTYKYSDEALKSVTSYAADVEKIIANKSEGELQQILGMYKKMLSDKEYMKLHSKVYSTVKSLDKSIDIETVQYFDKVRDLRLGSAPSDVILSMILPLGGVGYYTTKAKDNDERVSVALKAGVPVIGAVGTSLYCTARLISGSKALIFGTLSGLAIAKAGAWLDNARKKYSLDVSFQNRAKLKAQSNNV